MKRVRNVRKYHAPRHRSAQLSMVGARNEGADESSDFVSKPKVEFRIPLDFAKSDSQVDIQFPLDFTKIPKWISRQSRSLPKPSDGNEWRLRNNYLQHTM